jgi:hypothetical protein
MAGKGDPSTASRRWARCHYAHVTDGVGHVATCGRSASIRETATRTAAGRCLGSNRQTTRRTTRSECHRKRPVCFLGRYRIVPTVAERPRAEMIGSRSTGTASLTALSGGTNKAPAAGADVYRFARCPQRATAWNRRKGSLMSDGLKGTASNDGAGDEGQGKVGRRRLLFGAATAGAGLVVGTLANGGSADAATGGDLILGRANTAKSTTSVTTTSGVGLSATSSAKNQAGLKGTNTSAGGGNGVHGVSSWHRRPRLFLG